jgi:uncharacterized repeat protein (TIGR01451 family)
MVKTRWLSVAATAVLGAPLASHAAGTPAGTSIQNTAQVSYSVGTSNLTHLNTSTSRSPSDWMRPDARRSDRPGVAGANGKALVFTLTNTGNGSERFHLTALSAGVVNDDFDPTLATPAIYFDTDNSGDFSGGDVAYNPGVNDPLLAPTRACAARHQQHSEHRRERQPRRSQLTAAAATAPGRRAQHSRAGRRRVEAVAGTTGGDSVLFGEYLVADVQLTAVKSQTILDQFGGARPLPGARINYQIVVTPSGSGTATNAAVNDLIPANTTYVANSLQLNGAALSDTADSDAGTFVSAPAARSAGHPRQSDQRFRSADGAVRRDHQLIAIT